jgi:hypothetical protein
VQYEKALYGRLLGFCAELGVICKTKWQRFKRDHAYTKHIAKYKVAQYMQFKKNGKFTI